MHDNADSVKLSAESSPALVEQAAQAIRYQMAAQYKPTGEARPIPFGSSEALIQYNMVETEDTRARRIADAVLAVVAPLLRAEGAAAERERIKQGTEVLLDHGTGWAPDGTQGWVRLADVLALVSREAEAATGGERDG
jgi:hypothetical protein